ncbi:hypothetical protein E4U43_001338 [Claviceps pusilla]|uniref:Aminoglycoside phosphotransferase domain-containing protein n=1 Tax=Claviceps pusilla TaxID=123648 RepID=A0A9P7N8G1_9HYPO|nr:hypothetical protein E4U43_001338 [Claviceps pusilla]
MAGVKSPRAIEAAVREHLHGTQYAVLSLKPLTGGTANFLYHAELQTRLANGVDEVLVKHGEGYVAQHPDFALTKSRCEIEVESLRLLSAFPHVSCPAYDVGTPDMYFFDATTSTQIQEYLPNATSLKDYALKHYPSPTSPDVIPQCVELGQALGRWLRAFHTARDTKDTHQKLRTLLGRNSEMQALKKSINYDQLLLRMQDFPALVSDERETEAVVRDIVAMASAELRDESRLDVIHGDFWTGNILLPDAAIQDGPPTPIRIIDWEMAQLGVQPEDVGQLLAELWLLKLYRDIDAGTWILQGFVDGYGSTDSAFALRALLHVGAHLICFGARTPGWGTAEQNERVARMGWHVLLAAWRGDEAALEDHEVGCVLLDYKR